MSAIPIPLLELLRAEPVLGFKWSRASKTPAGTISLGAHDVFPANANVQTGVVGGKRASLSIWFSELDDDRAEAIFTALVDELTTRFGAPRKKRSSRSWLLDGNVLSVSTGAHEVVVAVKHPSGMSMREKADAGL